MRANALNTPLLLFNLYEVLVRDDEVLCAESFPLENRLRDYPEFT